MLLQQIDHWLGLAARVDVKYRPTFEKLPERERAAVAMYFLPHGSKKEMLGVTRPRVIKLYCPFADQREFPSGHRYCINVYSGCEYRCQYCYASGYVASSPNCKNRFRQEFCRDLEDLEAYDVPPAPVHLSNSTDPLQGLEKEHRNTLFVLEKLAEHRRRFSSVTLLTKNPAALTEDRYIQLLKRLNSLPPDHARRAAFDSSSIAPLRLEVSLAFFKEEHRQLLDPAAPSVVSRMESLRRLRSEGLPVFLRIDPLFPRDPLPSGKTMADFGLSDVQSIDDLERLVAFAKELHVEHIIYSVAKITRPRSGTLPPVMERMKRVYQHLASGQRLVFRGCSWRLPPDIAASLVVEPFVGLCARYGVAAKACKANLLTTP